MTRPWPPAVANLEAGCEGFGIDEVMRLLHRVFSVTASVAEASGTATIASVLRGFGPALGDKLIDDTRASPAPALCDGPHPFERNVEGQEPDEAVIE